MQKTNYLFLFLLSTFSLVAQEKIALTSPEMNTRFFEKEKIPSVKGQVLNYTPTAFPTLNLKYTLVVPTGENAVSKVATIQPDGTFELALNYSFPYQQITLTLGDYYTGEIFVNEEVFVELDMAQLQLNPVRFLGKGVQFSGLDASINVYLNRFYTFQNSQKGAFYQARQALVMGSKMETDMQVRAYEAVYKKWDKILSDYTTQYPSEHAWILQNERDSDYYGWLFTLFWQKEIPNELFDTAINHQPYLISKMGMTYYKYLARLMKLVPPGRNFALTKRVLEERVDGGAQNADLQEFLALYQAKINQQPVREAMFQIGIRQFLNGNREELRKARLAEFSVNLARLETPLADVLKLFGAPNNKWKRKAYYKYFLPQTGTNWVSTFMIDEVGVIETYTASVQRTLPAPITLTTNASLGIPVRNLPFDAALYLGQGETGETFVATLQNAFPNKALILDVWATWCRPCIADMKRSKTTKKSLADLPLEIIYLAVEEGSDQQKWEQTVNNLQVAGQHIFIKKDLADSLLKYFNLFGYPSYILIDRNGNWDATFVRSISNLDIEKLKGKL